MIAEVEGERGALPLLAFACAQLWERRDRERGVLSRAAYQEIGGVGGRAGAARRSHARAHRAGQGPARARDLPQPGHRPGHAGGSRPRRAALGLPGRGARRGGRASSTRWSPPACSSRTRRRPEAGAEHRRLEIVHESLLTQWPRLVRWRAQDEEGAVLRDQLRQAAQLWDQRGRAEDFLWTGTAYREYQLWRERYPGGLTALEEAFARAMHRARAAARRRRQASRSRPPSPLLATGLAVVTVLAAQQSGARQARRAEASKLLALGQVELESNPTVGAGVRDQEPGAGRQPGGARVRVEGAGRRPAGVPPPGRTSGRPRPVNRVVFSPDGAWAAVIGSARSSTWSAGTAGSRGSSTPFPSGTGGVSRALFDAAVEAPLRRQGRTGADLERAGVQAGGDADRWEGRTPRCAGRGVGILAITRVREKPRTMAVAVVAVGATPRPIGRFDGFANWDIDREGSSLAFAQEKGLFVGPLTDAGGRPRPCGHLRRTRGDPLPSRRRPSRRLRRGLADRSACGRRRVRVTAPPRELQTTLEPLTQYAFDRDGRTSGGDRHDSRRAARRAVGPGGAARRGAAELSATFGGFLNAVTFSPDGRWLATANFHAVCFWPLTRRCAASCIGTAPG